MSSTTFSGPVTSTNGFVGTVGATTPTTGAFTSLTSPLNSGGTAAASTLTLQSTSGAGTTDFIDFKTASQTERMRITSSGDVGIGTAAPAFKLEVVGDTYLNGVVRAAASSSAAAPGYTFAGDSDTGIFRSAANTLGFSSNGLVVASISPSTFAVTGDITATGSIGYTTGSGGAVTQTTNRTTGVTLNKANGAITLVSAAGSVTYQSFTVTNSTVAATDTVIVSQKSGTDLNQIFVTAVAAGSFRISFATTGGTTTEQPVFNFAVIKGVAA